VVNPGGPTENALNQALAHPSLRNGGRYDPNQPRDWHGRWTSAGGGGASTGKPKPKPKPKVQPDWSVPELENPVHNGTLRPHDGYGKGHYGAGRKRKKNGVEYSDTHKGIDIAVNPGKPVYSPVKGTVESVDIEPYPNDPRKKGMYTGVSIRTDDGALVRVLYVNRHVRAGTRVEAGTPIGTAQDLSKAYPPTAKGKMTNHVHVDVKKNGVYYNPSRLMKM
jgi:murein DD-endopeptidase MepM/ murein hydrolase activator NlpD